MENIFFEDGALYLQNPSDLFYFTHYKNADAKILFWEGERYYFTDARYFEEVEKLPYIKKNIADFYRFIEENSIKKVYSDGSVLFKEYCLLKERGVDEVRDAREKLDSMRAVKSDEEIAAIEKAQKVTDNAFKAILSEIKENVSEKELDRILKSTLYTCGADGLAFDPIVAFGKNTSKPHAHPTDNRLKKGDFVTLDFGAVCDGYCSDMTRTLAFGEPTDEMKKTYALVKEGQERALDRLYTGITGKEGHEIVASFFRENGVEKFFTHSLGHSLGIDIHENPNLSPRCGQKIPERCVTSVEPGLYFAGEYGVRIEDIVVFGKNSVRNLTNSEKNMIIL